MTAGGNIQSLLAVAMIMIAASGLPGCAAQPSGMSAKRGSDPCPSGTTLVCAERMGKPVSCTCKGREDLRDILEPYPE